MDYPKLSIEFMQEQHGHWQRRNFPDQTYEDAFMGMVEEQGELAHILLKRKQGIRGFKGMSVDEVHALIMDAHADWIIFSFGLANGLGYSLEEALVTTWLKVRQRDWVASPTVGQL